MGDQAEQYTNRVKDITNFNMPEIGTKSSDSVMPTAVNNMNV